MTGLRQIAAAFAAAQAEGRAALMPYYTLGYPDAATSVAIIRAVSQAGADLIELGVPFSDPLADGPTIQRSTQVALKQGASVPRCLELTAELRSAGVYQPLLLMGYFNPILAYGVSRYVGDAVRAGADGFIVPDLPPTEAGEMESCCRESGSALVYLLAPTADPAHAAEVAARSTGFLYLVSVPGVTGARSSLNEGVTAFVAAARKVACTPVAVGFGISTPEQAAAVGRVADGVIVGSALIDVVDRAEEPIRSAGSFVGLLRESLSHR